MSTNETSQEIIAKLREMAAQILSPNSKGKEFFNRAADEIERANAACAEMRDALLFTKHCKPIFPWLNHETKIKHALSTDCGKGYHADSEWEPVVEALKWCVDHCGGYDRQQAKEALAHAAKLTEGK